MIKIRTLAEAGVPLARIRDLRSATGKEFQQALREINDELTDRIQSLRATQRRLRQLGTWAAGTTAHRGRSPSETPNPLGIHTPLGGLQRDLWILVFATLPDRAATLFDDQAEPQADPALRQLYLDYDHAYDLDVDDPRMDDLACRIVEATRERHGPDNHPSWKQPPRFPPSSRARSTPRPWHGSAWTRSSARIWTPDSTHPDTVPRRNQSACAAAEEADAARRSANSRGRRPAGASRAAIDDPYLDRRRSAGSRLTGPAGAAHPTP
ncbi:hypothetical protein [Streptomyces violascens]|uniref:MerR family transcriptional regulator n=1 Tax=Streptomyces violascens TaxID=67381 RepID=A0ABQ3QTJ8_9ACTN|nr:hypothetical protein [Streptomyces violascens]GHI40558.1 hypothetical protein Sviol_49660 [Streptomyces violascens]